MGASSAERLARMARIHELELLRQEALHKTESITRDEEARLLQLRILILRDDNADLRDEIGQRNFKISAMMRDADQLRLDLEGSKETMRAQEAQLKKQDMEMVKLKAEIEALNVSTSDAGKLLQEKFALKRELERLQPELEHLQSQLTAYQATVAEKNDLRRQLDAVEAELDNEKRSRQRLQSKNNDAAVAELASRLEEAEERLAAERKEGDKMKRELEKQVTKTKAENERLEERVSSLEDKAQGLRAENERLQECTSGLKDKTKGLQAELKEAKESLREARSELAAAQSRPVSRNEEHKPKKAVASTTDAGKKRRARVMSFEEITIQTPGNDVFARERPTKKRGADKVMATVGEKSVFSITPFLNRNKSLLDDSAKEPSRHDAAAPADPKPPMSDEPAAPEALSESEAEAPRPKTSLKASVSFHSPARAARPRAVRQAKAATTPLGESTPAKTNRVVRSRGTPKVKSIPETRADDEAADCGNPQAGPDQENVPVAASKKMNRAPVLEPKVPEAGVKKKKRKLLGGANTTLLDGDDGDDGDDDGGEALMTSRSQPAVPKRTRARLGGGVRNAFAAASSFSPLKRDRRGVNASFLA
ncbi:hypothetical protein E4U42_000392 [Claviceps africana]|uniref:Uncharacterized protein n=1 Tax=Claviceps africana TaxID=83212 RepID=A0A8K0NKS5_9HYPO|nr:hypothetical protein E4U42_000392 [Claviceps africana]